MDASDSFRFDRSYVNHSVALSNWCFVKEIPTLTYFPISVVEFALSSTFKTRSDLRRNHKTLS